MENYNEELHKKIAVVILNWNGVEMLTKFLPSVVQNSQNADIYVVDNASSDHSVTYIQTNYRQIKVIRNTQNEGFCKGYNLGLQQIEAEYYVLLNNDVEVSENWLLPMVNLMEGNHNIAVCQPKIKSFLAPENFEYAGACGGFLDKNGYPFCRGRIFDIIEKDTKQYDDAIEISWATGACFFVRSSIFKELQGFDEDFFAHMEEIDFCWRSKNAGHIIMVCPQSTIYHLGGGTLASENPQKTFLNFRNGLYLLHKNLPKNQLFHLILIRLVMDGISGIKFLFEGKTLKFLAVVRAHFAYYQHIGELSRKRFKHKNINILQKYSIVWRFFVLKNESYGALIGLI